MPPSPWPGLAPLPTFADLLQGLKQRWFLGLTASLLGAVLTGWILLQRLPHFYTASVWLKLEPRTHAGPAGEGHKDASRPATEGSPLLLRSPPLLNQVLARTEVAGLPEVSGQQADAVIRAARAGRSRLPWINDAWYRLGQMGVPRFGVVVNGAT